MNPIAPDHLSPADRLAELAELLARGLIRLHARKSSSLSAERGESFVDFSATRSGHPRVANNHGGNR